MRFGGIWLIFTTISNRDNNVLLIFSRKRTENVKKGERTPKNTRVRVSYSNLGLNIFNYLS